MHRSATPDHALHDPSLVAAHAAGDTAPTDTAAAAALLSTCDACSALHRELLAITAATRSLPRLARAPRDFRLTAEQAERLRRGSWLRSILRPFAIAGSGTRPLAAAFTSVGIAGLLVAAFLPSLLGGAASSPNRDVAMDAQRATAAAGAPEVAEVTAGPVAAAGAPTDSEFVKAGDAGASSEPGMEVALGGGTAGAGNGSGGSGDGRTATDSPAIAAAPSTPNVLVVGSSALLVIGLALFGLRFAARRVG